MVRYFIDLHDAGGVLCDEEGAEYGHLEEALDEAKASARDVVRHHLDNQLSLNDVCVEVRDEQGRTVAALTVAEVMAHPVHPHFRNHCPSAADPSAPDKTHRT
jgi:hypothetical protein